MTKISVCIRRNSGIVSAVTCILLVITCLLWGYNADSARTITITKVTENKGTVLNPPVKSDEKLLIRQTIPSSERIPKIWTYSASGLKETNTCNNLENLKKSTDFSLDRLQSVLGSFSIYIHDPKQDYISSQVKSTHNFEPHIFGTIYSYLNKNKEMNLIDVGANIGIISLQAALLGRNVISIDAAESNIQHICASAHENNAGGRINLIHNAVSDNHTSVSFVMGKDGEFGASFMDDKNLRQDKIRMSGVKFDTQNLVTVNTVILDDLLYLPNIEEFKTVFIKLDVEGSEHKVLLGARKLFRMLNVRGVLMEWRWHVKRPESKTVILTFMTEFGFEPYAIAKSVGSKLDGETMDNSDVIWLPKQ